MSSFFYTIKIDDEYLVRVDRKQNKFITAEEPKIFKDLKEIYCYMNNLDIQFFGDQMLAKIDIHLWNLSNCVVSLYDTGSYYPVMERVEQRKEYA